ASACPILHTTVLYSPILLRRRYNVFMNLDGFYRHHYPDHRQLTAFPFPEYQGFVRQAVSAFGAERCMWGSEFPFLNNGYDAGLRFLREACDFLSEARRGWVWGRGPPRSGDSTRCRSMLIGPARPGAPRPPSSSP